MRGRGIKTRKYSIYLVLKLPPPIKKQAVPQFIIILARTFRNVRYAHVLSRRWPKWSIWGSIYKWINRDGGVSSTCGDKKNAFCQNFAHIQHIAAWRFLWNNTLSSHVDLSKRNRKIETRVEVCIFRFCFVLPIYFDLTWLLCTNTAEHFRHLKKPVEVCLAAMWFSSSCFWMKALWQVGHMCLRFPLWKSMCDLNCVIVQNTASMSWSWPSCLNNLRNSEFRF